MLGGRPPGLILRSVFEREQYAAAARMVRLYPAFGAVARRYFLGGGRYPWECRIRTPIGVVAPRLYSHHDVFTVQEIFAREDYRAGAELRVAVDIGSNIGISALYFLSRNPTACCYLFEPVPRNLERLRGNLAAHTDRYEVQPVAVAATGGRVQFTIEPTGRYGGIGVPGAEQIDVECRSIADVLEDILARESTIDMLKIDTEGAEAATVQAIPDDQLARIRAICFETATPLNPAPDRFRLQFACETCRLDQRAAPAKARS